ncbi:MAG: hypothetical protein NT157_01120 [Candidatus Micrarchaeota archaeon]|nr:hypothetical protein [Candidatus Micrarchaeota archaeon]
MMELLGYWDAFTWGCVLTALFCLAYLIFSFRSNEREIKETFLSGEDIEYSTPIYGFFYGFEKALAPLFHSEERFHSEIIHEYVAYLLIFSLIALIIFLYMASIGGTTI